MNFFDMGMFEILVVLTVAILIFGPGRIPAVARQLGQWMRAFKRVSTDLTKEFAKALDAEDKTTSTSTKMPSASSLTDMAKKAATDKASKSLENFLGGSGTKKT